MQWAISIPQVVADGTFDGDALREFLGRAEALGFHSAWTQEQVIGTLPLLSPLETMAWAAACTERLRLGCTVFVSPLHTPAHLAKALASLDQLSRGRVEVGIGTGGQGRPFGAFGIDGEGLVSRFTEGLRVMRALWTEPSVTLHGRFWQLENAAMEPKPFQKPHPPVWFGGGAPAALRRTVRLADGFFGAGSAPVEAFVGQLGTVRRELAEQGRDPATLRVAKRVYVAVGGPVEHRRLIESLRRVYAGVSEEAARRIAVSGTPEQCAEQVRRVAKAGAGLVLFTPMVDDRAQLERLAGEVIPLCAD